MGREQGYAQPGRDYPMIRRAFTLVELMIVFAIVGVLAAIVMPKFASWAGSGRAQAMATTVHHIRELVHYHENKGDIALSPEGYPAAIPSAWFKGNEYPRHAWNAERLIIQVVNGPATDYYPATKTFDVNAVAAVNAWYNASNGSFIALVGVEDDDPTTLRAFNEANLCDIPDLTHTTR